MISTSFASLSIIVSSLCYTFASVLSGKLVNRLGRKQLAVTSATLAGLLVITQFNMPNMWITLVLGYSVSFVSAVLTSTSRSLNLEQLPRFRGPMMSINTAANNIGLSLGTGLGGLIILLYNYEWAGIFLGAIGVFGALLYHLFAIDSIKKEIVVKRIE